MIVPNPANTPGRSFFNPAGPYHCRRVRIRRPRPGDPRGRRHRGATGDDSLHSRHPHRTGTRPTGRRGRPGPRSHDRHRRTSAWSAAPRSPCGGRTDPSGPNEYSSRPRRGSGITCGCRTRVIAA